MIYYVYIHTYHLVGRKLYPLRIASILWLPFLYFSYSVHFHCQPLFKLYRFLDWEQNFITKSLILTYIFFLSQKLDISSILLTSQASISSGYDSFSDIPVTGIARSQFFIFFTEVRISWLYHPFSIPNTVVYQYLDYSLL